MLLWEVGEEECLPSQVGQAFLSLGGVQPFVVLLIAVNYF